MTYTTKNRDVILRQALQTLQASTPVTATAPGSVARALAEVMAVQVADFYSVLDFNTAMGAVSSSKGRALELFGALYGITRKELSEVATIDQSTGTFYFYLEQPHTSNITIPAGTRVFTDTTFIGRQFSYSTTANATIMAGRTRVYVGLRPEFLDSIGTTGANTLTTHNADVGVPLRCTNPKPIIPQVGFESDENLRTRIIKAVRTAAGGTIESMRFAALGVMGLRDVVLRSAPYGLGSAEALVIPEDPDLADIVLSTVGDVLQTVTPVGIRLFVRLPEYTTVDIDATVILRRDANITVGGPQRRAENAIIRHLNTMLPGGTLVYNRLVQAMIESSDVIDDVAVTTLRVGGAEILRRNYTPKTDEQLVPGTITIASA